MLRVCLPVTRGAGTGTIHVILKQGRFNCGSGRRLQHTQILTILVHVLGQEGERLIGHHPRVFTKLLQICQSQLDNRYLKKRYLSHPPQSSVERETVGQYRLLEALVKRLKQLAAAHAANQGFSLEYQKAIG